MEARPCAANGRGNGNRAKQADRGSADANTATLAQVRSPGRRSAGLIIRRSWVRSPPAPLFEFPHVKCVFVGRQVGVTVTSVRRRPLGLPMGGGPLMTVCCWQAHLPPSRLLACGLVTDAVLRALSSAKYDCYR